MDMEDHNQKLDPRHKKDGNYSWVLCFCCFIVYLMNFGLLKSTGVVFVSLYQTFEISKADAAKITTLTFGATFGSGVFCAMLIRLMGYRWTIFLGVSTSFIGLFSSYFAKTSALLSLTFGFLLGTGCGISNICTFSLFSQFFKVHLSKATGIAFTGGGIGGFVFPPLTEYIIEEYGLGGAFLLMSGIFLHLYIIPCLVIEPPEHFPDSHLNEGGKIVKSESGLSVIPEKGVSQTNSSFAQDVHFLNENEYQGSNKPPQIIETLNDKSDLTEARPHPCNETEHEYSTGDETMNNKRAGQINEHAFKWIGVTIDGKDKTNEKKSNCTDTLPCFVNQAEELDETNILIPVNSNLNQPITTEPDENITYEKKSEDHPVNAEKRLKRKCCCSILACYGKSIRNILKDELVVLKNMYCIPIALAFVPLKLCLFLTSMTFPDIAVGLGYSLSQGAMLISIIACADIASRLISGFLLDLRIISLGFTFGGPLLVSGICFILVGIMEESASYGLLAVLSAVIGAMYGLTVLHFNLTASHYMGPKTVPTVMSFASLFVVIATFISSPLLDYFIKHYGRFANIFYICASLFLISCIFWLVLGVKETRLQRSKEK